ncbi:MAG: DUF3316 domain-containing protein [Paludibacter sp.]|nr:DUF3316 domain-containing protein [Paludibacter sp.]
MIKKIFIIGICFFTLNVFSQITNEKKYLLTNNVNTIGISTLSINDPYLSPLTYSGVGIRYNFENRRFFTTENTHLSKQNKLGLLGGLTLNPAFTSSMTYLGLNYSWGMHYHFRPMKRLLLLAGGSSELDLAVKNVPRNVNNPANVDLAVDLNLSGVAIYDIKTRKRIMQLQLAIQSPLFGCMFVPRAGASYYEMFDLWNLNDAVHFSSLHNKRGIQGDLMLQIPFNRTIWRFGIGYHGLKYSANELVFKRNEISLLIGTSFDMTTFAGKKNPAPKNFIGTNE